MSTSSQTPDLRPTTTIEIASPDPEFEELMDHIFDQIERIEEILEELEEYQVAIDAVWIHSVSTVPSDSVTYSDIECISLTSSETEDVWIRSMSEYVPESFATPVNRSVQSLSPMDEEVTPSNSGSPATLVLEDRMPNKDFENWHFYKDYFEKGKKFFKSNKIPSRTWPEARSGWPEARYPEFLVPAPWNPKPIEINGVKFYYLDCIVDKVRIHYPTQKSPLRTFFAVRWIGWSDDFVTLEPRSYLKDTGAIEEFEARRDGYVMGSRGLPFGVAIPRMARKPKLEKIGKPAPMKTIPGFDKVEKIIDGKVKEKIYSKLNGFIGRDKYEAFGREMKFWTEVLPLLDVNAKPGFSVCQEIIGNPLGNRMKTFFGPKGYGEFESKIITKSKAFKDKIRRQLKKTPEDANGRKVVIFVLVFNTGKLNQKRDEFRMHSDLFFVEDSKDGRNHYYWTSSRPFEVEKWAPYKLVAGTRFDRNSKVWMFFENIIRSGDCVYRCVEKIADITNGGEFFTKGNGEKPEPFKAGSLRF